MISNNSSVIINNSRDEDDEVDNNEHDGEPIVRSVNKNRHHSPTNSLESPPSSRSSFSPIMKTTMVMTKLKANNNPKHNYKNSLSSIEDSEMELNHSSAASTLSSTGNSSSTSGIANSITYFPFLDEEDQNKLEISTPDNKKPHSLRFFVNPNSGQVDVKSSPNSTNSTNTSTNNSTNNKLSSASFRLTKNPRAASAASNNSTKNNNKTGQNGSITTSSYDTRSLGMN